MKKYQKEILNKLQKVEKMNDAEKLREYISCPQFGDNHYGKLGSLCYEDRCLIKRNLERLKGLEQINEEHRKLNGTLHEELDKYKNIVDEIKKDLYNILHNLEKYDETAGYVPEHLEYATNYTEQAIDKLKELKGE